MLATIRFYDVALFLHVAALVMGLGATFFYPVIWRHAKRRFPRALPAVFHTQEVFGKAVIGPSVGLIIASGIYLVLKGPYDWDSSFVQVGLPIAVALFLSGPLWFSRREVRLAELAEGDIAAAGNADEVTFSEEFERVYRQLLISARIAQLAILVAVFYMVVKP